MSETCADCGACCDAKDHGRTEPCEDFVRRACPHDGMGGPGCCYLCDLESRPEDDDLARLRRRVAVLESRLARVLRWAHIGGARIRWMRGNVWSRRATPGRKACPSTAKPGARDGEGER